LREALAEQDRTGKHLGLIFLDMRALSQAELTRQVAAKAEETIRSLFDWDGAVFRFHDGATLEPNQIEVNLSVRDVLFRGLQHHDELNEIRKVFTSSGIVLRHADKSIPPELLKKPIARRIFESIDGKRTVAEILLHAHASDFLVVKLLNTLYRKGLLAIAGERSVNPDSRTILDTKKQPESVPPRFGSAVDADSTGLERRGDEQPRDVAEPTARSASTGPVVQGRDLDVEVEVASRLMARGEHEAALELLNASYRANAGESYLRRLIFKAETAYVDSLRRDELPGDKIPVLQENAGTPSEPLGSEESFLVSLIDGESDIQEILWVAPLREVDGLRALRRMLDRGLIRLNDPDPVEQVSASDPASA
jgi:hypothetical protein